MGRNAEPESATLHSAQSEPPGRAVAFFRELRQRKVCRAALVYALTVWVIFQIAETVFPALGLPEWALGFVVMLGILGFPIALVLAWAFEITPEGLVIDIPHAKAASAKASKKETLLSCSLLALGALISLQLLSASLGDSALASTQAPKEHVAAPRSVAVLPFVSASSDPESTTLGYGVVDELRHLLRTEHRLNVIASTVSGPAASEWLDKADILLEGSVNTGEESIRITMHLVDPNNGFILWSGVLEEPRDSSVALQKKIAARISAVLPIQESADDPVADVVYARVPTPVASPTRVE